MDKGDLVYVPAGATILQYNKEFENIDINPDETYIGPAPVKFNKLEKPMNLLLIERENVFEKYVKVYFKGEEWFIDKTSVRLV